MSDINTLRSALFATLAGLQDKENPLEIDRARAVCDVARELTSTAKVEIDFLRLTGNTSGSGFLGAAGGAAGAPALPNGTIRTANGTKTVEQVPGGSVTTHTLR